MIIKYSENNESRIEWQHQKGGEWKTAELDELIEAYERGKTGEWVRIVFHTTDGREKIQWCCSECGQAMYQFRQRFCSNCGARMANDNG